MKPSRTTQIVLCALFTALTCVLAPLSVPMPGGVPITLATLAVMISGLILGPKWGACSQAIYLLLGCIGLPVFAGYSAGAAVLSGPTGGFLIGYLLLAFFSGSLDRLLRRERKGKRRILSMTTGMVVGTIALYAIGTVWFIFVTQSGLLTAITACVLPFLIGDAVKIAVTALLVPKIEDAILHATGQSTGAQA